MSEEFNERSHYLLTAIGINHVDTKYSLKDKTENGRFSTPALIKMLPKKPTKIFLLLTKGASEQKKLFENDVNDDKIEINEINIPDGINKNEINEILQKILKKIPKNCDLTIDITNGLRHFPFLLFTSALYLRSLKNININGVYYGALDLKNKNNEVPFVNISVILEMIEWFYAARMFAEEKNAKKLYNMIEKSIQNTTADVGSIKKLNDKIIDFDLFYSTNFTLSLGDATKSFVDQFKKKGNVLKTTTDSETIPLLYELMVYISESIDQFKLNDDVKTHGNWKSRYSLTTEELKRQISIIDSYLESGHYINAIQLMREWVVSRCIWSKNEKVDKWLTKKTRRDVEQQLGSINWQNEQKILQEDKKGLAELWNDLTRMRNSIAHCEMNEEKIKKDLETRIRKVWCKIKDKNEINEFWNPYIISSGGKLLVTPVGMSKGLLYTALSNISPDICIIITSKEAENGIEEAIKKASYNGGNIKKIVMKDPFAGDTEIKDIKSNFLTPEYSEYRELIQKAEEIVVNLAGGTTMMQILVDDISKVANKMGKNIKKVVTIDRRDVMEQKKEPFVVGEVIPYESGDENNNKEY